MGTEQSIRLNREIWGKIFKISPEENRNFSIRNEIMVNNYLNQHYFESKSYQYADIDRLNTDNFMTCPTTKEKMKQSIKEFRNGKAPGISGINKVLLLNLPDVALGRHKEIINLMMSEGY